MITHNHQSPESLLTRPATTFTSEDVYLFNEGRHLRLWDKLGAHATATKEGRGTTFGVWAPNARQVSVIGEFNDWNPTDHLLRPVQSSGIWEGFIPNIGVGETYKYHI